MNIILNSKINKSPVNRKMGFSILFVSLMISASSFLIHSIQNNHLYAEENSNKIVSEKITSEFPDGIKFQAEFSNSKKIQSIKLKIKFGTQERGAYNYMNFTQNNLSQNTTANFFWRTDTPAKYVPPNTFINYEYEITYITGEKSTTKSKQSIYLDPRFEWKYVSNDLVNVAYHGPVKKRAEIVLDSIDQTVKKMNPVLFNSDNEKINLPIRVTLYNNYKEMISALPAKSKTVSRELVTEGQAFTSYGTVLVLGSGQLTSGTASHEATHILSHRAGEGRIYKLPQWLDEGLAEYGNIQPSYSYDLALEFAIGTNRLITPITLSQKYPSTPEDVIIFYGQSRSLVSMIISKYGKHKMRELMANMKKGTSLPDAIQKTYNKSLIELENEWRTTVKAPLYTQEKNQSARPTAIPQKKLKLFSLTPQAGAETIGSNENNSEKKNSSKSTKGSCQANGSDSKDLSPAAIIILVIFLVSRSKKISKF